MKVREVSSPKKDKKNLFYRFARIKFVTSFVIPWEKGLWRQSAPKAEAGKALLKNGSLLHRGYRGNGLDDEFLPGLGRELFLSGRTLLEVLFLEHFETLIAVLPLVVAVEHAAIDEALLLHLDGVEHPPPLQLLLLHPLLPQLPHLPQHLGLPVIVKHPEGFLLGPHRPLPCTCTRNSHHHQK